MGFAVLYTFFLDKDIPSEEILIKVCQYNDDKSLQVV